MATSQCKEEEKHMNNKKDLNSAAYIEPITYLTTKGTQKNHIRKLPKLSLYPLEVNNVSSTTPEQHIQCVPRTQSRKL